MVNGCLWVLQLSTSLTPNAKKYCLSNEYVAMLQLDRIGVPLFSYTALSYVFSLYDIININFLWLFFEQHVTSDNENVH